jgi:hypothetical protein
LVPETMDTKRDINFSGRAWTFAVDCRFSNPDFG